MSQLTVACLAVLAVVGGVHGSIFSVGRVNGVYRNGKVHFENVITDSDNSWRYDRSQFECSDEGYYYITFHALAKKDRPITLQLKRNGREEIVRAYGDGNGYNTASNSAIVYVYNRDRISLHVSEGELHESRNRDRQYTTLSGYKIGGFAGGVPQAPAGTGQSGGAGGVSFAFGAPAAGGPESSPPAESEGEEGFTPLSSESAGPSK